MLPSRVEGIAADSEKTVCNLFEKSWQGVDDMLYRKIESLIEEHLRSDSKKILLIDGARLVGKTEKMF